MICKAKSHRKVAFLFPSHLSNHTYLLAVTGPRRAPSDISRIRMGAQVERNFRFKAFSQQPHSLLPDLVALNERNNFVARHVGVLVVAADCELVVNV